MTSPVWLITGASSLGLGYYLSLHALSAGHRVIATVRNVSKSSHAVQTITAKGGKVMELDMTDAEAVAKVASEAESVYGAVDVLVNNAGYSLLGAVEDLTLVGKIS